MRVSIVTGPWLPVPAVRGGAMQKSWHGLAREMGRAGHEVTVVARTFPGQPQDETLDGVRILRTRGFSQGRHVAWDLAKDWLYAWNTLPCLPAADILVTNDFWLPALAARFRKSAGAVVVSAGRFPKGQYRLYRRAARIVAISGAVREAIAAEQPQLAAKTVVIPLPVAPELFARPAEPPEGGHKRLLYVGRIHPEKGQELLLRAFANLSDRFPDWELEIVGPVAESDGGGGGRYLELLRGVAAGSRVEFRAPVFDAAALAAVYRSADLFCYPSLSERGEAFGVAALESMAAGVPPVVSDLACFRDFVREGENGWVFDHRGSGAEKALTQTLARAMGDEALRKVAGRAARREAERFSFASVAAEYLLEFARIVEGAAQG